MLQKRYLLNESLPDLIQELIGPENLLEIEEEKIIAFPKTKTLLNVVIFNIFDKIIEIL